LMEKKKKPAASAHSCDNNSNSMIHIRSSWKSTTTTTTTTTISQNTHELKCMIPTYITSKTSGCRSFVHFNLLSTHQKPEMRVSTKPNNPITYHKHKMTSIIKKIFELRSNDEDNLIDLIGQSKLLIGQSILKLRFVTINFVLVCT
jgi:hypothetical protein